LIAAFNCGTEALTLGSLMILASGFSVSSPSQVRSSLSFWLAVRFSGKFAMIRPAKEISRVSTSTPAALVKACTIGSRE
jgi:hypothetical protein